MKIRIAERFNGILCYYEFKNVKKYIYEQWWEDFMKDILITTLSIAIIIYALFKNRKTLKKLTWLQNFSVGISYLAAIFLAFILIYYGGNWVAGQFSNIIFKYLIFLVIVCIAIYLSVSILNKVLNKVTNGILPKS
ncbi:hypothetical protein [Virgibacillus sp. SK37]|uniref:hypothetical protein n=1 Tax=Virgibacillus sp. SK37 TaxID=403957 RepID=UPI0011A9562A|nr:hypothetical protein [Virgibacillus sp. SK37]